MALFLLLIFFAEPKPACEYTYNRPRRAKAGEKRRGKKYNFF
jgi:hypothetical protein